MVRRYVVWLSLIAAVLAAESPARGLVVPIERARRVPPRPTPPGTQPPGTQAPGQRAGRPPVREVRQALRDMQGEVQTCAVRFAPREGPRRRRIRVRVWLYPNGRWTMEVPEAQARRGARGAAAMPRRGLSTCIETSLRGRIQPLMRPFARRTRLKIEHAYAVRMPGPPPSEAELARHLVNERARLLQCVPGQGRGERAELIVRATLQGDGSFVLVGLGVPEGAPFDAVARCVVGELRNVSHAPVLAPRTFEAALPMRWAAPSP